jgi:hypothetical protein
LYLWYRNVLAWKCELLQVWHTATTECETNFHSYVDTFEDDYNKTDFILWKKNIVAWHPRARIIAAEMHSTEELLETVCSNPRLYSYNKDHWEFSDHWATTMQIADPSSHQRGHPTETRPEISDSNLPTGSNIWSQVPEWARHQNVLTDRPTVSHKAT